MLFGDGAGQPDDDDVLSPLESLQPPASAQSLCSPPELASPSPPLHSLTLPVLSYTTLLPRNAQNAEKPYQPTQSKWVSTSFALVMPAHTMPMSDVTAAVSLFLFVFADERTDRCIYTACSTGGFYKSPSAGQTIQSGQPLNISWDTSCMTTDAIDIYLYNPAASNPRIHLWENVNYALGSYETSLKAQWWNSSDSASLQLAIVAHSTPLFMATLPAGPLFTATYSADSDASGALETSGTTTTGAIEQVNNFESHHGLAKGKIAAAVLIPLLVIIALVVGAYIKISRSRGREQRKQWTEAVDKRMSTISTDWKSISPAGATAAIRSSMAVSGDNRASSFSFGAIRPSSTVAVEGGQAGIGAKGMLTQGGIDTTTPQMSQLRSGLRNPIASGDRVSRISFAADTRPSVESRRSIYSRNSKATSRAFHTGHVPPLPGRQDSEGMMSPTQAAGPLSLTPEEIHARMTGMETAPRPSMDEMMPALSRKLTLVMYVV